MTNQTHRTHRPHRTLTAVLVAALAVAIASCVDSDTPVIVEPEGGEIFARYVSLGNSITAGFQSGGIVNSTQEDAYPAVLADKAGARFGVPSLAPPGCPPLLVGPLTTERTSTESCGLRSYAAPDIVQNLAVPGANAGHVSDPLGTNTTLNTLILGGRTQLRAMQDADPTLVSVWVGNMDALIATLIGDTLALTPEAVFQAEYDEIVSAIVDSTDAQDAILIGVANPIAAAPILQPGAYFYALAQNPPPGLPAISVDSTCAPFDGDGNPNPLAARMISFAGVAAALGAGEDPLTIDCVNGVQIGGGYSPDYLLDETEIATATARINAFNAYIDQQADDNGWIYIDPAGVLAEALTDPDRIRKCQGLATATDAASFVAAVQNTCPVDLDPTTEATFFGSYFSFDGVHPSSAAHRVLADSIAARLNAVHGLSLDTN